MNDLKKIFSLGSPAILVFYTGVLADIFFFDLPSDIRYVIILVIWTYIIRKHELKSETTYMLALSIFVLTFTLFVINRNSAYVENATVWVFLTLLFGLVQQFIDLRKKGL
jgi:hypothetical protein